MATMEVLKNRVMKAAALDAQRGEPNDPEQSKAVQNSLRPLTGARRKNAEHILTNLYRETHIKARQWCEEQ